MSAATSATFYILVCSGRNRLRRRLARLREPRYLFGALVGAAYLYFSFFGRARFARNGRGRRPQALSMLAMFGANGPLIAALTLFGMASLSLAMPFRSGLLQFSRAETEFLIPSPLSARQLVIYRLTRPQWGVVLGALITSLTYPLGDWDARVRTFFGMWLVLATAQLFFAGVALTRVRVTSLRGRLLASLPRLYLAGTAAAIGAVGTRIALAEQRSLDSAPAVFSLLLAASRHGLPRLLLKPFELLTLPLLAQSMGELAWALPGALLVYAVVLTWVLSADEGFATMVDSLVTGQMTTERPTSAYRVRGEIWTLAPSGRPETPFIWKTVTQALRVVSRRALFRLVMIVVWLVVVALVFSGRSRGFAQVGGILAVVGAAFTIVFGPQLARFDLRQDLQHLELLKTWPVRAAAVIRGEMLGSALVVTVVAWTLGLLAMILSAAAFPRVAMSLRLSGGVAAFIVAPALILAQCTVHNAAALFFPAWISTGPTRPRGVDAMGQRIIMLAGTWLVLVVAVLPAAIVGGVLWWAFQPLLGSWILIPSALAGALIMLLEVAMATEALAPIYDRLDVTGVERNER